VVADIPGLIEGAAGGAGLGTRFLKHLSRTRLLLHVVDMAPAGPGADPAEDVRTIVAELNGYSPELAGRERWLVLNKLDLLPESEQEKRCDDLLRKLAWDGPVYRVSALRKEGCRELIHGVMGQLEAAWAADEAEPRSEETAPEHAGR
jgi:GTP-binding protein